MKSIYKKPGIKVTTVLTEPFMVESEKGVIIEDMAKENDIVEEEKTGIPSNFSNIWGDEEDED